MTPDWWCCNCEAVRDLDNHGRCSCCSSDSVCVANPGTKRFPKLPTHVEFSKMFEVLKWNQCNNGGNQMSEVIVTARQVRLSLREAAEKVDSLAGKHLNVTDDFEWNAALADLHAALEATK